MLDFRLVQREGIDTLHRWPSLEECNVDDASAATSLEVSLQEAARLIEGGTVDACRHCEPLSQPSGDPSGK